MREFFMSDHFEGKSVPDHLIEARKKGAQASKEIHGVEPAGYLFAGLDAAKTTAFLLTSLAFILTLFPFPQKHTMYLLALFAIGLLFYLVGRSALIGWGRLERVHRVICEERNEIKGNRDQERQELQELYRAKGFSGQLLDQVVEVLMADDDRLLEVMLQEELGLTLESFDHPIKQSTGAGLGVIISFLITCSGFFMFGFLGMLIAATLTVAIAAVFEAKSQRNDITRNLLWNIAVLLASLELGYLISLLVQGE